MTLSGESIAIGQVWEHVGNKGVAGTGMRMRITQVPDGRKRTYRWVLVDPIGYGYGHQRPIERRLSDPEVLHRVYRLVSE